MHLSTLLALTFACVVMSASLVASQIETTEAEAPAVTSGVTDGSHHTTTTMSSTTTTISGSSFVLASLGSTFLLVAGSLLLSMLRH